jgi:hypothetical protein
MLLGAKRKPASQRADFLFIYGIPADKTRTLKYGRVPNVIPHDVIRIASVTLAPLHVIKVSIALSVLYESVRGIFSESLGQDIDNI